MERVTGVPVTLGSVKSGMVLPTLGAWRRIGARDTLFSSRMELMCAGRLALELAWRAGSGKGGGVAM